MPPNGTSPSRTAKRPRMNDSTKQSRPSTSQASTSLNALKSSLRQTKRLLTRDKLNPKLKIETERRLETLLKQIGEVEGQRSRQDQLKRNQRRYSKTKFTGKFLHYISNVMSRLKPIFRENQTLASDKASAKGFREGWWIWEFRPRAQRAQNRSQLCPSKLEFDHLLYYLTILKTQNFPTDEKYISLFINGNRLDHEASVNSEDKTEKKRKELRQSIREKMENETFSAEPEKLSTSTRSPPLSNGKADPDRSNVSLKLAIETLPETPAERVSKSRDTFFEDASWRLITAAWRCTFRPMGCFIVALYLIISITPRLI